MEKHPGKTLVLGGGYIAIECAGFLKELGGDVTLINRSNFLRVFDQGAAQKVKEEFGLMGIRTSEHTRIVSVSKSGEKKRVEMEIKATGERLIEEFDTVLIAIGRQPSTRNLNLEKVGVQLNDEGKVSNIHNQIKEFSIFEREQTAKPHIYAIGDCQEHTPELMPVAAKSGHFLAKRIAERIKSGQNLELPNLQLNYKGIPTTIFSPLEYSFVGMSEEEAIQKLGEDNIEIYHSEATSLERSLYSQNSQTFYTKVIIEKTKKAIVGIHYVGPNAGELIAGYSLAMQKGLNFDDLESSFGVHPTTAEELHNLRITKRSGEDFRKTEC